MILLILCLAAFAEPQPILAPKLGAARGPVLSSQALQLNLSRALELRRVPQRAKVLAAANKLPVEHRQILTAMFDPNTALAIGQPELTVHGKYLIKISSALLQAILEALTTPALDTLNPQGGGSPAQMGVAVGSNFNGNCKVVFNGTEVPTLCVSGGVLDFMAPATATAGTTVPVLVRNTASGHTSSTINWKIVAPRGYRGVYGLGFANFTDTAIPWDVFKHCFGAATVEFAGGAHRPSADAWYNSTYKACGTYGNCFGMALLSLRIRAWLLAADTHALDTVIYGDWIKTNMPWAPWALPGNTQMKQSVQECMAYQLCKPISDYCTGQKSAQNNKQAWDVATTAIDVEWQTVQESLYGHAVVTYDTTVSGTTRTFDFYDNNVPYTETETGGPNKSLGNVNWTNGAFSYGGYSKIATYHLSGLMGPPQLPPGVGGPGDSAADHARFEVPRDGALTITDEQGRGGADGQGVPGLFEIVVEGGLGAMPPTFPRIFILQNPGGRSLNFSFQGQGTRQRTLTYFGRGVVLQATCGGAQVQASFSALGNADAQIRFANPQQAAVSQVRLIGVIGTQEERMLNFDQLSGLGGAALGFGFSLDRSGGAVSNAGTGPVNLRLQIEDDAPADKGLMPPAMHTIAAGRLTRLAPMNWGNLRNTRINRGLENLPGGMK